MMIFRYCLCCFGYNRSLVSDSKNRLANQSTSTANKQHEVHTASRDVGDATDGRHASIDETFSKYEAALLVKRASLVRRRNNLAGGISNLTRSTTNTTGSVTNLKGSKTNLTGSIINLAGSKTNLTGSKISLSRSIINLAGSKTNLSGSKTNLSRSIINLAGSKTNLSGSKTNLSGSKTNLSGSKTNLSRSIINLAGSKTNLSGSKTNLSRSIINLAGSRTNLTGSKTNLAGSQTSSLLSGQQLVHPPSKLENEIGSDSETPIAQIPQASPNVEKDLWGGVLMKMKRETIIKPTSLLTIASAKVTLLPAIRVVSSSSTKMSNSNNSTNSATRISSRYENEIMSLSSSPKTSMSWLKSQSMMNVNSPSFAESAQTSRSTVDVSTRCGLNPTLCESAHLSKSLEVVKRIRKSMDNFVNEDIFIDQSNGSVHFIPFYSSDTKKLAVEVKRIEGLAPKGYCRSSYNCVIKLTILPNEKYSQFSKTIPPEDTLNLDECFIFNAKDPAHQVLRISVYDADAIGKFDAVGHALFYITDALTHGQKSHTLKLYRQSMPDVQTESCARSIKIIFSYEKQTELLSLFIKEAYNLPIFSDKHKSYLKLRQYNFGMKVKEIHSPSIRITKPLLYQFSVDLNIDSKAFQDSYIVIDVKMQTFFKERTAGRVILGPYFYAEYGKTLTPWGRALINRETVSHIFRLYK